MLYVAVRVERVAHWPGDIAPLSLSSRRADFLFLCPGLVSCFLTYRQSLACSLCFNTPSNTSFKSMPAKKKPPALIKGSQFNGIDPLTHDDIEALSVDGFGNPAETLLDNISWSREIVALTGIRLSPENLCVANSAVFLLGSLAVDKRVNMTKVWNFPSTTYLTLTITNSNIFSFPNGALQSEYVDSSAVNFKFSRNGSALALSTLSDLGYKGFSLRVALAPTSPTYTKLWLSLVPFSLSDLLISHPLTHNPSFPALKILDDIPLAPLSSGLPLEKDWVFPNLRV